MKRNSQQVLKLPRKITFVCNPRTDLEGCPAKRHKNAADLYDIGKRSKSGDKDGEKLRSFKICCSPSSLVAAIRQLSEMQKKAVEDIGFGGLLSISISKVPKDLLVWLLQRFRPLTRTVECNKSGEEYKVGWADVRDIFLLPHSPKQPVSEWKSFQPSSPDIRSIRERWEKDYGFSRVNKVNLTHLLREMLKLKDGGDDFKRMFVLYALSSFLVPAYSKTVRFSTLESLLKVDEIKNFDWCEYVIEHLCSAVHCWQEDRRKEHVGGCLLLLLLSYLNRGGKSMPRSLPLIQYWNNQNSRDRIAEELISGRFGLGDSNLDEYPVSKEVELEEEDQKTTDDDDDDATFQNKYPETPSYMNRVFREIHEIRCKIDAFGAGASKEDKATNGALKSRSKEKVIVDNGDREIVDDEDVSKKNSIELIDLCGPETDDDQAGDLANNDDQDSAANVTKDSAKNDDIEVSSTVQPEEVQFPHSEENSARNDVIEVLTKVQPEAVQAPHPQENPANSDDIEVLPVQYGTDTISKPDCDVLYTLKATRQEVFVTKLLRTYPSNMKSLRNYEAQIADFCISSSNSFSPTFPLFSDNHYTSAGAQHFTTLELGEGISSFIMNSWARLLNSAQFDPNMPSKLCLRVVTAIDLKIPFTILLYDWDYFLKGCSRNVLNTDLIFVPVYMDAHYFLLVVNFKNRLVQYLDNLGHDIAKGYEQGVERVKNAIASFLEHHKHPEAESIKKYEVKAIEGQWRNTKRDNDSGVYAMHHMDTFTGISGDIDDSPVMKADSRNVLRAKFCSRLILSPVNTHTRNVLSGVSRFNFDKSSGRITN